MDILYFQGVRPLQLPEYRMLLPLKLQMFPSWSALEQLLPCHYRATPKMEPNQAEGDPAALVLPSPAEGAKVSWLEDSPSWCSPMGSSPSSVESAARSSGEVFLTKDEAEGSADAFDWGPLYCE